MSSRLSLTSLFLCLLMSLKPRFSAFSFEDRLMGFGADRSIQHLSAVKFEIIFKIVRAATSYGVTSKRPVTNGIESSFHSKIANVMFLMTLLCQLELRTETNHLIVVTILYC